MAIVGDDCERCFHADFILETFVFPFNFWECGGFRHLEWQFPRFLEFHLFDNRHGMNKRRPEPTPHEEFEKTKPGSPHST